MLTTCSFQIGSAEWVEENREMLAARVVAYLNVDCAVQGGDFRASATPQLDELIIQAAQQVPFLINLPPCTKIKCATSYVHESTISIQHFIVFAYHFKLVFLYATNYGNFWPILN